MTDITYSITIFINSCITVKKHLKRATAKVPSARAQVPRIFQATTIVIPDYLVVRRFIKNLDLTILICSIIFIFGFNIYLNRSYQKRRQKHTSVLLDISDTVRSRKLHGVC